jgi:hypothetical protein
MLLPKAVLAGEMGLGTTPTPRPTTNFRLLGSCLGSGWKLRPDRNQTLEHLLFIADALAQ